LLEQERLLTRMRDRAWQAMDGTLNTGDRMELEPVYLQDLARIEAVARNVRFHGIPLLDGAVDVGLTDRPPVPGIHFIDLPDTTALALGIADTSFYSITSAMLAFQSVGDALATVIEHRERIVATAHVLINN